MTANIVTWLAGLADRYPQHEATLPAGWPHNRDITWAMFVVRAMTDGSCPGAAAAVEWVDHVRAGMVPR